MSVGPTGQPCSALQHNAVLASALAPATRHLMPRLCRPRRVAGAGSLAVGRARDAATGRDAIPGARQEFCSAVGRANRPFVVSDQSGGFKARSRVPGYGSFGPSLLFEDPLVTLIFLPPAPGGSLRGAEALPGLVPSAMRRARRRLR